MSNDWQQPTDDQLNATAIPALPQKKGWPVLAWIVIVLLVALVLRMHAAAPQGEATAAESSDLRTMEIQARLLVGVKDLLNAPANAPGENLYAHAQAMNAGSVEQRLRFIVVAGELAGPAEAHAQLNQLEAKLLKAGIRKTAEQATLMDNLRRLYEDYMAGRLDAPSLTNEQRQQLRTELGWFGQLALAPAGGPDPAAREAAMSLAHRTALVFLAYVAGLVVFGLFGCAGLVLFVILLFSGKLRRGIHTGVLHGGVYAETFAVWMALFLGLSLAAAKLPFVAEARWLVTGLAFLLSLSALFWPVLRGIPWSEVRWEIGLKFGKQPLLEPAIGVATYAMALPMVALGLLVILVILAIAGALQGLGGSPDSFEPIHYPSHPIVEYVLRPDWWARLQVLLLASVIAPIVEETMFRGVLYRHLREASARFGFVLSTFFSAFLVSFLFAVIHPQGLIAVPLLMALALTFCLVREWRGTLLPAMIAHGINNGLMLTLLILAMGD
jgi:membrane protease YdiL (CAAX protease family)